MALIYGVENGSVRDNGADWAGGLWGSDPRESQAGEEKVENLNLCFLEYLHFYFILCTYLIT